MKHQKFLPVLAVLVMCLAVSLVMAQQPQTAPATTPAPTTAKAKSEVKADTASAKSKLLDINTATAEQLDELKVPRLELPTIADGVDLGSLYELSESLAQQGVR